MPVPLPEGASRRYHHQLEPASLIRQFVTHPPEGFVALGGLSDVGDPPAFEAPFDLLTTADDDLKRLVDRLPLARWWRRLLQVRTAFVGSTVSEYALLADGPAPQALAATLRERLAPRYRLLIVKDLPQRSPLLSEADNAYAEALVAALQAQGFVLVDGQALAYVPIDFRDADEYLSRLSTSRRKNLRRKLRSRADLQIERIATGRAFDDDAVVDAYYALYAAVYAQSEIHFDRMTRDFFAAVLRDVDNGGIVFEYRAQGELIGWNLCFESDGRLIDKTIGLRYPQARDHNLYFVSWIVNLEYALERGLTHYVAGWTDPEVKAQLGARFTLTRHAVYVRNPVLRLLARRLVSRFEGDNVWTDKAVA